MAFAKWKNKNSLPATLTVATLATVDKKEATFKPTVAEIATVAVAEGENEKVILVIHDDEFIPLPTMVRVDNPVISANSVSSDATNDHALKSEVKLVIQETVRQLDEVSTNGVNLKPTTDNLASEMQEVLPTSNHCPKSAVENSRLTQSEETYPPTVDGKHSPWVEAHPHVEDRPPTWSMDRYAHMVKCQQCEHLTSTGYCRVKPQVKPIPEAMIDCESFDALNTERISIASAPYTQSELNALLGDCEKKLFQHFVKGCDGCSFMDGKYCAEVFTTGNKYEAILFVSKDAASKREALLNTVIRARISGRKAFVGLDYTNIGEPQQQAVKPLVYGIGDSERLFVNHLMVCDKCKPASRTYCADGLQLKANADSNYQL